MKKCTLPVVALQRQYDRLRRTLAQTGYISQGSVLDRSTLDPSRSGYQWTRKVRGKTITVALSAQEFAALGQAIANERKLSQTIRQMEQIARRIIFGNRVRSARRKSLSKKVLGLV
jgi:hypothetical protein